MNSSEAWEEFFVLLYTCAGAVFTFALLCVPGAIGGFTGMLPQGFIGAAAKLNMNMLLPCLIIGNVGRRLDSGMLAELWPLLTWSAAQCLLGLVTASAIFRFSDMVLSWCRRKSKNHQSLSKTMGAVAPCVSTMQNCVGFGLPMVETLCQSGVAAPGKAADECFEEASLYLFTYMLAWQIFLWTVVYGLFGSVVEKSGSYSLPPQAEKIRTSAGQVEQPLEEGEIIGKGQRASDELRIATGEDSLALSTMAVDLTIDEILGDREDARIPSGDGSVATGAMDVDLTLQEKEVDGTRKYQAWRCFGCSCHRRCCCRVRACSCSVVRRCCIACKRGFCMVINPALVSLAIAISIASWPWAKRFLFIDNGFGRPFGEAVQKLGNVVPIVATTVMSASLGRAVRAMCGSVQNDADKGTRGIPRWAGVVLIANRLMFIPALGLAVMLVMEWTLGGTSKPLLNNTMRTVILLQLASPAANNCIVLCQRFNLSKLAEDLATVYAPMYLICLLTVPAYLSIGLYIFNSPFLAKPL